MSHLFPAVNSSFKLIWLQGFLKKLALEVYYVFSALSFCCFFLVMESCICYEITYLLTYITSTRVLKLFLFYYFIFLNIPHHFFLVFGRILILLTLPIFCRSWKSSVVFQTVGICEFVFITFCSLPQMACSLKITPGWTLGCLYSPDGSAVW